MSSCEDYEIVHFKLKSFTVNLFKNDEQPNKCKFNNIIKDKVLFTKTTKEMKSLRTNNKKMVKVYEDFNYKPPVYKNKNTNKP